MAVGLSGATGAHAAILDSTVTTDGFLGVGGVLNANGLSTSLLGGSGPTTGATTSSIAQETYITFVLPTLAPGTQFADADFNVYKTSALNTGSGGVFSVFAQPDFSANLVAAAAPASLVAGVTSGTVFAIGTDSAKDPQGNPYPLTTPGGVTLLNPDGTPDGYHTTAYENTILSDPNLPDAVQFNATSNQPNGAPPAPTVPGLFPLSYQTLETDFLTPTGNGTNNYAYNGYVSTSSSAAGMTDAVTNFLNAAYADYGAGSTVTFSLAPSEVIDASPIPSGYAVSAGGTNGIGYLSYSTEPGTAATPPATNAVPESSPLTLLGLGLTALIGAGLRVRKRHSVPTA
jgi:hypothetical protein